jgi:hypothetical protein
MSVPATIAPTLGKLIPLLASNHDGEVIATARAIDRVLKSSGRDWHDLAATLSLPTPIPSADWRREARFCAANAKRLSERELDFIVTLARYRGIPSPKQQQWLRDIADRLRSGT